MHKPKRPARSLEQIARQRVRNRILRRFWDGWKKDIKASKVIKAREGMLPGTIKLYEKKQKLIEGFFKGKIRIGEIRKARGLFSEAEINRLAVTIGEISGEKENILRSRKRGLERREKIKRAKYHMAAYADIGEKILNGEIKTVREMLSEFERNGISRNSVWNTMRHWQYGFDELLTKRRLELTEDIMRLREKSKGKRKFDLTDADLFG